MTHSEAAPPPPVQQEAVLYGFDRYINGRLMAEGVTIERKPTIADAAMAAARIASRGPNGETPVLVLRAPPSREEGLRGEVLWELEAAERAHREAFEGDSSGLVSDEERAKHNLRLWHAVEAALYHADGDTK